MTTKRSNLVVRLATAAVLAPLIVWLDYRGPSWGMFALTFIGTLLSSMELMRMVAPEAMLARAWGVIAALVVHIGFVWLNDPTLLLSLVLSVVVLGLLVGLFQALPLETAGLRSGWLIAGPLYTGGLLSTLALLHTQPYGPAWVILSMMLAWFGDTGGYFAGRFLGRRPLHAKVSPKKTIEGSIGGLLGSLGAAFLAAFWFLPALPVTHAIALAIVAGALGQAGDLCESVLKRSTGIKDSGTLLPGHGGLLDRIDALLFTAAVTWAYASFFFPGD